MNVLFRVDAYSSIGMGHLMRCLALAQGLAAQQHSIQFLIKAQSQAHCLARKDWVGELVILPECGDLQQEARSLCAYLADMQPDILVLDGYQFDERYRSLIGKSETPLILFDDTNRSGLLHADLIINSAANAHSLGYRQTAPQAKCCLGSDYRVLRQEFVHHAIQQAANQWHHRQVLTIVMGGSDPFNVTLQLLQQLQSRAFSSTIEVVTGSAYVNFNELEILNKNSKLDIIHQHNCQTMAEVFTQSKLVVSAAGGTQFELCACGTPAILLVVADNQINATQQAVKQGWCESFEMRENDDLSILIDRLIALWEDEPSLESMHQQAKLHADIQGTQRVVAMIEQFCAPNSASGATC